MDEVFFKSTFPVPDPVQLDDTSLALPAELRDRDPDRDRDRDRDPDRDSDLRSVRVQQQVQITLARKAKKSLNNNKNHNGSVHLQRNTVKSFEAPDRFSHSFKINGVGLTHRSLSTNHVRRPSRRVEVSPSPSPEFPRRHFLHGSARFASYTPHTHPGPGRPPPRVLGPPHPGVLGPPPGSGSFLRYAFSEAPTTTRPLTSHGSLRPRGSLRLGGPQPQSCPPGGHFRRGSDFGSRWSRSQSIIKRDQHTVMRHGGAMRGGGVLWDGGPVTGGGPVNRGSPVWDRGPARDGFLWDGGPVRDGSPVWEGGLVTGGGPVSGGGPVWDGGHRQNSYSPSAVSMEVDFGRKLALDPPTMKDVPSLNSELNPSDLNPPELNPSELTLERAVNLLSRDEEETLISAAATIQNQCYKSAEAKKMVFYLRGIRKLLLLLGSDSEEVQRGAAGALRNVLYQSTENKMEVKENEGLEVILTALKTSRDTETRRQLTGVLWNLSSDDQLKDRLSRDCLSVLTRSVLVPTSGISEGENPKDELLADNEAFHNATGCLRNLSSAGPDVRKSMRECENFIDSLVYYVRGAVADYNTDDKSTENCVCILHNLSYQIEAELPQKYASDLRQSRLDLVPEKKSVGCFTHRGAKITERVSQQRGPPLLEEKSNPRGVEWLWSSITIRMYLSLLACSHRHGTLEGALGALQNITAGGGQVTESIALTVVQRENGLQHIKKLLEEGERKVKGTAVALVKNLSRYPELHPDIVSAVLPQLVAFLPHDDSGTDQTSEVTAALCHTLINLSQNNKDNVRNIINLGALNKIINISSRDNGFGPSRAGQAASVLLHTMWRHRDLHGAYKKCGYRKSDFINARTIKAVNSG